ncbi:MAG: uncharacterized protein KVP18_004620 [Porospora cf. gigantea A]|uniref:uncharacterized protein n=3 Tax=Porospora cf. gigantea A TaxID=2853593 RepID=UPI00355A079C|nr:MAG: hypothetical protein KVP18_004620 [Porospora cf. gigantea A]
MSQNNEGVLTWNEDDLNVKAVVRIRPPTDLEATTSAESAVWFEGDDLIVPTQMCLQRYGFDAVLPPDASQSRTYACVCRPLLESFYNGFNSSVLAYGQTGSGKTYTIGSCIEDTDGLVPQALRDIFGKASECREQGDQIELSVSYIELYNEDIRDLSNSALDAVSVRISQDPLTKSIQLLGIRTVPVDNPEAALLVLRKGSRHRSTAATAMNSASSRSHAIFTVHLRRESESTATLSKFHFVDLAGSERLKRTGAQGERLREGISINSGLLGLSNVISALTAKHRKIHVPYRDSKLTRIIQDSLGGNSRTVMVACVSPTPADVSETVNTVRYASRARNIQNAPQINTDSHCAVVSELRNQVHALCGQVQHYKRLLIQHNVPLTEPDDPVSPAFVTPAECLPEGSTVGAPSSSASEQLFSALDEAAQWAELVTGLQTNIEQLKRALRDKETGMSHLIAEADAAKSTRQRHESLREQQLRERVQENKRALDCLRKTVSKLEREKSLVLRKHDCSLRQADKLKENLSTVRGEKREIVRKLNVETKKYSCAVKQKDKSITAIRKELNTAASRFRKQEMSLKKEMDRLQKRNDALQRALNLSRAHKGEADLTDHLEKVLQRLVDTGLTGDEEVSFDMEQLKAAGASLLKAHAPAAVCESLLVDSLRGRLELEKSDFELTAVREQLNETRTSRSLLQQEVTGLTARMEETYKKDKFGFLAEVWKQKATFLSSVLQSDDDRVQNYLTYLHGELKDMETLVETDNLDSQSLRRASLMRCVEDDLWSPRSSQSETPAVLFTSVALNSSEAPTQLLAGSLGECHLLDLETFESVHVWDMRGEESSCVRGVSRLSENGVSVVCCGSQAYLVDPRDPSVAMSWSMKATILAQTALGESEFAVSADDLHTGLFEMRSTSTVARLTTDTHLLSLTHLPPLSKGTFQGLVGGGRDKICRLWDNGWRTMTPPFFSAVAQVDASDSGLICGVSREGRARVWHVDAATINPVFKFDHASAVRFRGSNLLVGDRMGVISVFDTSGGDVVRRGERRLPAATGVAELVIAGDVIVALSHNKRLYNVKMDV